MNLFNVLKRDFVLKNNLIQLENDLTAWLIVQYHSFKENKLIMEINICDAKHFLWKIATNPTILDYNKTLGGALKRLVELHNFDKPLVDGEVICLKRKI